MNTMTAVIEAERLVKSFGATRALAGVDLQVASGQVFALLGPDGAGKTTIVRVLATLLKPTAVRPGCAATTWCRTRCRSASCWR